MASLKEVKTRIASVNSTRKITSAMKMVASSKLHHAQQSIERMRPYEHQLTNILSSFVGGLEGDLDASFDSPYVAHREIKRVALVLYASNASLCGGFNANVIKRFQQRLTAYQAEGIEVVKVYAFGKKAADAARKAGFEVTTDYAHLMDHPSYEAAAEVAADIMSLYEEGNIDGADLIYHHFKSAGTQLLVEEPFLPVQVETVECTNSKSLALDYIVEPSKSEVIARLIPKSLHLKLYTAMLDSLASEHAARVIAMQVATDNADDLLKELTLTYNKTRQQAITAELLDIVGGSMQ